MEANPERGEVELVVGDGDEPRRYVLRMRLNALCAMQKRTGKSYGDLQAEIGQSNVETIREMLWTYLQPYHANEFKKLEQAGDLIDEIGGHIKAIDVIFRVWQANRPKQDIKPEREANPRTAGTGIVSSETASASA